MNKPGIDPVPWSLVNEIREVGAAIGGSPLDIKAAQLLQLARRHI